MKRRWFAVLGAVLLGLWGLLLAAFGLPPTTDPWAVGRAGLFALAGVLFVLGGVGERVGPWAWYRYVGLGDVALALVQTLQGVQVLAGPSTGDGEVALAFVLVPGSLALAFIGLDWFRGGNHFDLSRFEPGAILAG